MNTEYETDRFEHSAVKDANGFRVMPGFEFDPLALIGGKVYIGYRHFDVLDKNVPDYSGARGRRLGELPGTRDEVRRAVRARRDVLGTKRRSPITS